MSVPMKLAALILTASLLASPQSAPVTPDLPSAVSQADAGPPFVAAAVTFASPPTCVAHLTALIRASAPPTFDSAVGPYAIAPGDVRAHRVSAKGWGHEIEEHRCLGAALGSRTWSHSMSDMKPITIDDISGMSFPAK